MLQFHCKSFRELSLEELYQLLALRQEVFVVEQDCPYLDADGKDQASWHLLGLDAKGEIQAYTRLLPEGLSYPGHTAIGRVVTAMSVRRTGAGRALMQESVNWLEKHFPQYPIKLSAQVYLIRFYESFGFQTVGEEYLEDGIPHIAMVRAINS